MVTTAQPKTFQVHDFIDGFRGLLMGVLLLLDIFYVAVATKGAMPWYNVSVRPSAPLTALRKL
jgi:hypothetical protein